MMKKSSNAFGLLAAACASGAAAEAPRRASSVAPGDQVICKKAAPAGTRFRTETCYTMAEWDKLSEVTRRDMGEMVLREPNKKKRTK